MSFIDPFCKNYVKFTWYEGRFMGAMHQFPVSPFNSNRTVAYWWPEEKAVSCLS